MNPFAVRIFVADGDPDGLRIVEHFNASARAVVFPRALLPPVKARPEHIHTCVNLVLGAHLCGPLDHVRFANQQPHCHP